MPQGWVYSLTNRPNDTLYGGMTSDLVRRIGGHRDGAVDGFRKTHALKRLVYFEEHETITGAIQREKNIKPWPRSWKTRLILEFNRRLGRPVRLAALTGTNAAAPRLWPGQARP